MPRLNTKTAPVLAIGLLLASYGWYCHEAELVGGVLRKSLPLRRSLGELPLNLGDWQGSEAPLDESVVKVAKADDHISRSYYNRRTGDVLKVYIPYYGNPRTLVGHYPDVCYPAAGYTKQMSRVENVPRSDASEKACPVVVYYFEKGPTKVTVISFHIVGGICTASREVVRRETHRPIGAETGNYLAQVQITLSGYPPVGRALEIAGDFLSKLLPLLEENHLPSSEDNIKVTSEEYPAHEK